MLACSMLAYGRKIVERLWRAGAGRRAPQSIVRSRALRFGVGTGRFVARLFAVVWHSPTTRQIMTMSFLSLASPAVLALSLSLAAPVLAQDQAAPLQGLGNYSLPPSRPATAPDQGDAPSPRQSAPSATPPTPAPGVVVLPSTRPAPTTSTPPRRTAPARDTGATPTAATRQTPPREAPSPARTETDAAPTTPTPTTPAPTQAPPTATDTPSTTLGDTPPPAPAPTPALIPQPDMAASERGSGWLWWLAALAAVLAAGVMLLLRRRGATKAITAGPHLRPVTAPSPRPEPTPPPTAPAKPPAKPTLTPEPALAPAPPLAPTVATPLPPPVAPVAPAPDAPRPAIDLDLRPARAGLNLLSALVEGELTIVNNGADPIDRVQIVVGLLSAHKGQDDDLAAWFAQPPARPVVPPFTLAPGESRAVRIVAPTARTAVQPMTAGDRPIFVPLVACLCQFVTRGDPYRAARAFAVGIERVDSPKLAPIWLDLPPRMYDAVAARPHALPAGVV